MKSLLFFESDNIYKLLYKLLFSIRFVYTGSESYFLLTTHSYSPFLSFFFFSFLFLQGLLHRVVGNRYLMPVTATTATTATTTGTTTTANQAINHQTRCTRRKTQKSKHKIIPCYIYPFLIFHSLLYHILLLSLLLLFCFCFVLSYCSTTTKVAPPFP